MTLDPNRHYAAPLGTDDNGKLGIKLACGSEDDVAVSQISGVFARELEDGEFDIQSGPLLIDCAHHGKFIGLLEILQKGPEDETGSAKASLPILMIPLRDVEYVIPFGMSPGDAKVIKKPKLRCGRQAKWHGRQDRCRRHERPQHQGSNRKGR